VHRLWVRKKAWLIPDSRLLGWPQGFHHSISLLPCGKCSKCQRAPSHVCQRLVQAPKASLERKVFVLESQKYCRK
jgi:hypothetical protein